MWGRVRYRKKEVEPALELFMLTRLVSFAPAGELTVCNLAKKESMTSKLRRKRQARPTEEFNAYYLQQKDKLDNWTSNLEY